MTLTLFRAIGNGRRELCAQFRLINNNQVEADAHDDMAKAYVTEVRDHGIWSRKCGRTVFMQNDGADVLDAIADSLVNSSYLHAVVETPTPTDLPAYAAGRG